MELMAELPPGLFRVCGKYRLKGRIGSGSHGDVYHGVNVLTGEDVAVKIEATSVDRPKLRHEWKLYKLLGPRKGIPRVLWFGVELGYNILIMSRHGPSLEELLDLCGERFTLKTVLHLADQLLAQLEYIHDAGCVHRDLKPSNILIGTQKDQSCIYIIDFGLANIFYNPLSHEHIPHSRKMTITGTSRYMSIRGHLGIEHSHRDDLESLAYIFIHFLQGSLPWKGLEASSGNQKYRRIMKRKLHVPIEVLCIGLPSAFSTFLKYARDLPFDARPDYDYLRGLFRDTFDFEGYCADDSQFDWSTKLDSSSAVSACRHGSESTSSADSSQHF